MQPRPAPVSTPLRPILDPCQAPPKSPRVTCAKAKASCAAPSLVWVRAAHKAVLSVRARASVGSRDGGTKAEGRRRTQTERTRAAMATPTQNAWRRSCAQVSGPVTRRRRTERCCQQPPAMAASGVSWKNCAVEGVQAGPGLAAKAA